jgi:hypothetical protein
MPGIVEALCVGRLPVASHCSWDLPPMPCERALACSSNAATNSDRRHVPLSEVPQLAADLICRRTKRRHRRQQQSLIAHDRDMSAMMSRRLRRQIGSHYPFFAARLPILRSSIPRLRDSLQFQRRPIQLALPDLAPHPSAAAASSGIAIPCAITVNPIRSDAPNTVLLIASVRVASTPAPATRASSLMRSTGSPCS